MSLLNVTVKKANFQGVQAQQFNTYVTLKLQNVKSTTVTVKGANPCWEQDFLFETNDINTGLLVEVWSKGMLWDRALGYHYIPLPGVSYANEDDCGKWVSLDSDVEMRGGEVVGTANPTGHHLLIACRFEQPFDPENTEAADLQRKLEMLNSSMDQEVRAEQARRQTLYNIGHSGYSEDSDYTSDLNYPVGGQGANSSASQFRTAANQLATPQRSLETSRENSYERDDHQIPATVGGRLAAGTYGSYNYSSRGHSPRYDEPYPGEGPPQRYTAQQGGESSEPLSYNSRPRGYKEYRRRKHTWDYEDSQDGWYSEGYDYQGTRIDDAKIYSDTEYYPSTTNSKRRGPHRRPSLERQTTLYDEQMHYGSDMYTNDPRIGKMSAIYPECQTDVIRNDYYDSTMGYVYQDERYGQDDEDRQWDSGGKWYMGPSTYQENKRNRKSLPQRPASSIGINRPNYRPTVTRQRSYESEELDYSGTSSRRRKPLQPQKRPSSRQDGSTGKKLPPTPSQPSNVILGRKPVSLPATPGRQLPRTRTPSEDGYYKSDYNEDYNYAYRSSQDNLPQDNYQITSSHPDDVVSHQQTYTTDVYSTSVHIQDNQYVGDYSSKAVVDQYSQDYVVPDVTQDAYDATGQSVYNNSYVSDYQEYVNPPTSQSIYHDTYQGNTYPKVSEIQQQSQHQQLAQYPENTVLENNYQSVPYDKNNTDTYHDVYQDSYEDSFKQDSFPDSYKQDSYADSYKQDSFPDSYKQDSFPESYTDSYKDDNYQDTDNNQTQYGDFNMPVCSSNYEPTVTTSVYDQQYQYDNKYNVSTSTYDQQQQQQPQQQPQQQQPQQQQPYNHDQSVPTTLDNYKEQQQQQQQNYSMEYEIPYKENQVSDYKNDYEEYEDSYQDSYQGSFDEPYKNRDEKRLSEVPELSVTTPKGQTKTNGYQSSESEYFYQSQDLAGSTRRKKLGKQGLPQAEDSLELRDDELKDSFETAVSSVSSNVPRTAYSEYSTAGESSPVATTLVDSPASSSQAAVVNHVTDHVPVCTTTAIVHSTAMVNGKRPLARTESYVEEAGDDEYPEIMKELHRKDSQMSNQSHVSQHSNHSQKPKLSRGESYTSAEHYDETYGNRRESFRKARQDSYGSVIEEDFKPPLNRTDSYQKHELTRGVSVYGQNYATPQPISRAESYQRGYFKEQDSLDETEIVLSSAINGEYKMRDETLERYERGEEALARGSRENSLVEPYKGSPTLSRSGSPRGSITKQTSLEESVQMDTPPRSPPEPPADEELLDMVGAAPVPTQLKERPEMTAKQRWHWAYNKIIMQLNGN